MLDPSGFSTNGAEGRRRLEGLWAEYVEAGLPDPRLAGEAVVVARTGVESTSESEGDDSLESYSDCCDFLWSIEEGGEGLDEAAEASLS